jgi:endonuclease-3
MSRGLLDAHGGQVPGEMAALTALHGVGRKTASIVLGAAFRVPAIAVDRHVARVAGRLGLTRATDPDRIEEDLRAIFPRKDWVKATWTFVLHGRRICTPTPQCPICPVIALCPYPKKTKLVPASPLPQRRAAGAGRPQRS